MERNQYHWRPWMILTAGSYVGLVILWVLFQMGVFQ